MRNIATKHPIAPNRDTSQGTRRLGLNPESPTIASRQATKLRAPYVVRKKIVTQVATVSRSGRNIAATKAIKPERRRPRTGSPLLGSFRPTQLGTKPSNASACSVRGAPRMLPNALDSTAPQSPPTIRRGPKGAISVQIRGRFINASLLAE